jgi:hypothetical protein
MKKRLGVLFVATTVVGGCFAGKDVQVRSMDVRLVKIDTVYRQNASEKVLTWSTADNMKFYSFEPISSPFELGTSMTVLVRK